MTDLAFLLNFYFNIYNCFYYLSYRLFFMSKMEIETMEEEVVCKYAFRSVK